MRILFLTSRLPYPPDRGDRLRAFHFLRRLSADHEIHLLSFIAEDDEEAHLPVLQEYCHDVQIVKQSKLRSMLTVGINIWRLLPMQLLYYQSPVMQRLVNRAIAANEFDAVYVHLFRMAPYIVAYPDLYRVIDLTDVISQEIIRSMPYRHALWRLIYGMELPRIQKYERYIAEHFEESWLISEADRAVLAAEHPRANIRVVPNGVNLDTLFPLDEPSVENRLLFVGHMRVFHNIDAVSYLANQILPAVQKRIPNCTLRIVGADPAPEVEQLAETNTAITVTGFVPDLNLELNQAAVFVAPLRFSAGVQNKVLEAMAAGCPVITVPTVNAGVGAKAGRDILVAEGESAFVETVITLLQNAAQRQQIGKNGRGYVQQQFSWEKAARRMKGIESEASNNP